MGEGNGRNPSATKRGPGRRHKQGHKKASPFQQRGAGVGFVQHINPARAAKRRARAAAAAATEITGSAA